MKVRRVVVCVRVCFWKRNVSHAEHYSKIDVRHAGCAVYCLLLFFLVFFLLFFTQNRHAHGDTEKETDLARNAANAPDKAERYTNTKRGENLYILATNILHLFHTTRANVRE